MDDQMPTTIGARRGTPESTNLRVRKAERSKLLWKNIFHITFIDPDTGEKIVNTYTIGIMAMMIVIPASYYFKYRKYNRRYQNVLTYFRR